MNTHYQQLLTAQNFVRERFSLSHKNQPTVAMVLGSGLSSLADIIKHDTHAVTLKFSEIPHFGRSTVEGHRGELIFGRIDGKLPVMVMSGRLHRYEGLSAQEVIFPMQMMGMLGIKKVILTNAAGAIADEHQPGHIMVLSDHLNLTGENPLVGENNRELGPRFFDMCEAYDPALREIAVKEISAVGLKVHTGVYAGLLGPCYETPAEVRMLKTLGADAVGMSTVMETIAARHMGMSVVGISCLTNKAAGLSTTAITHEEVMENNRLVSQNLGLAVKNLAINIG
jgi:purine-nucleoside phosphorylase